MKIHVLAGGPLAIRTSSPRRTRVIAMALCVIIAVSLAVLCANAPIVRRTARFFSLMRQVSVVGYERGYVETYPFVELKQAARFLLEQPNRDRRLMFASYTLYAQFQSDYTLFALDLHLLLRLLFDLPTSYPADELRGFRWWLYTPWPACDDNTQTCNLLWPLGYRENELQLVDFPSTIGLFVRRHRDTRPRNQVAQYDYFSTQFPFRSVDDLD